MKKNAEKDKKIQKMKKGENKKKSKKTNNHDLSIFAIF